MNDNNNGFDPVTGEPLNNSSPESDPNRIDLSKPAQNIPLQQGYQGQNYQQTPPDINTGYNRYTSNTQGYVPPPTGQNGYNQGYDSQSYNTQGYNAQGYDPNGYPQQPGFQSYQQGGYPPQSYDQYGQNPYGGYGYNQPVVSTGAATASLVCGILSIVLCIFEMAFPPLLALPIVGIVLGIVHKSKHLPVGKGASTAGIITSVIGLILPILFWVLMIAAMPSMLDFIEANDPETYQEFYDEYHDQLPQWFSSAFMQLKAFFIR